MKLRRALLTSHLVVGVAASPFLALLGATGAVTAFESLAADVANAPLTRVTPTGRPLPLDTLVARVAAARPGATVTGVAFADRPDRADQVMLSTHADVLVDPYTARVLGPASALRAPLRPVHMLHTKLLLGERGSAVIGAAVVALLFLAATGLWLWWPLKIVRVREGASGRQLALDLHAALGIYSWIFLVFFAVTGAVVHWNDGSLALLSRVSGGAPNVPNAPNASRPSACDAGQVLSPDALLAAARAAVPGAEPTSIQLGPRAAARLRYPEDRTPAGRTTVQLDGCTGRALRVVSSRTASAAWRYTRMWNRSLHTGDVFGWPTRILAALASLSLPLVALTGPLLWLVRRRAQRERVARDRESRPLVADTV